MINPRAAPPSGGPPMPFCERCGILIGPPAYLAKVGLRRCPSCGVHACDRCWAGAAGACPGCGTVFIGAAALGVARPSEPASTRQRRNMRAPIAVGAVVFAVSAVAVIIGNPFPPAGGVAGAFGTPAAVSSAASAPGLSPLPTPSRSIASITGATAAASSDAVAATPIPTRTPSPTPNSTGRAQPPPGRTDAAPRLPARPHRPTRRRVRPRAQPHADP